MTATGHRNFPCSANSADVIKKVVLEQGGHRTVYVLREMFRIDEIAGTLSSIVHEVYPPDFEVRKGLQCRAPRAGLAKLLIGLSCLIQPRFVRR